MQPDILTQKSNQNKNPTELFHHLPSKEFGKSRINQIKSETSKHKMRKYFAN